MTITDPSLLIHFTRGLFHFLSIISPISGLFVYFKKGGNGERFQERSAKVEKGESNCYYEGGRGCENWCLNVSK